ncbi:MAG: hemerythrin domain-containing protein [Pyrinomonadaceae bacterium]|nr:hemerythrin domain-containing protein [Pyrinomonadaceae bacterium]
MNAIKLLKSDHQNVMRLFQKVKSTDDSEHQELFEKIKEELEIHTHIEETVFYPKMKESEELTDLVLEGIEEHHQVKMFLREISNLMDESEKFEPKLKVLMEDVLHHIQEEEGEMFPNIEELFNETALEELGLQLDAEKQHYKKSAFAKAGK